MTPDDAEQRFEQLREALQERTDQWRVRFMDGGIVVASELLPHFEAPESVRLLARIDRVLRPDRSVSLTENAETWFDVADVKDIAVPSTGDIVYPPERALRRARPALNHALTSRRHTWRNLRIISVLLGMMAIGGIVGGLLGLWDFRQRLTWPAIEGRLDRRWMSWERHKRAYTYWPEARYTFEVGGRLYRGARFFAHDLVFDDPDTTRILLSRFRVGRPVQVRYDPDDPTESYLLPGEPMRAKAALVISLVILPLCVLWYCLAVMAQKARASSRT